MDIRRRLRRVSAAAALSVLAVPSLAVLAPVPGAVGDDAQGPLRVIGQLPAVKGPAKHADRQDVIVAVDAPGRRLFKLHTDFDDNTYVVTYSLKTRIPHQTGIGRVGTNPEYFATNNYSTAFDSRRGNLGMLTKGLEAAGQTLGEAGTGNLVVYSDAQHKIVKRVHITEKVPGFYPFGITYSAKDDRYYAVGEQSAQINLADGTLIAGGKFASPVAGVVAIDAATLEPVWVRAVPQCQQVLYSKGIGGMVARSSVHNALYFACVSGGSPSGQTYPGHTGLVRLHIEPKGSMQDAPAWPLDYFAISGNYFAGGQGSGVTAYDASTDRFYVQSISFKTPGAFVFDGRLSAWVGFVASDNPVNFFAGLNEGLGHFYMGLTSGGGDNPADGIIVANVRQTPVPAGEKSKLVTSALITADAKTNRLFVRPRSPNEPYLVVEDITDVTTGDGDEDDYDADTSDTPDTLAADVYYAVGATGYGAQAVQVGGGTAPVTAVGHFSESLPKVLDRTRALMTARGSLDLRASGASSAGQSAVVDSNTVTEYQADGDDADDKPDKMWPYPGATCLDAGGAPVTKTWKYQGDGAAVNGATYTIVCDLAKQYAKTTVRMGASGSGTTYMKKTLYEAEAWRNRKEGAVVKTRALADGVTMELAGGADIRYGRVQSSSVSRAHGRPGTASSEWRREVTGIVVTSATGSEIYRAPGCASEVVTTASGTKTTDTCVELGKTISKLLPMRLRVEFPLPLSMATPKGAFSGVEQTKAEYLHQTVVNDQGVVYHGDSLGIRPTPAMVTEVYNDTTERSRTITVLAATQANAIFTVNPPYDDGYVPPTVDPGPGDDGSGGGDGGSGEPGLPGSGDNGNGNNNNGGAPLPQSAGTGTGTAPVADLGGFLFMRRSVKDMALLVLLSGLVLGGAGTAWRRRRLVEVLVTVPRKEAS